MAQPNKPPVYTSEQERAYRAGWAAFMAGIEDCPHSEQSPLAEYWIAGHNDAAYNRTY